MRNATVTTVVDAPREAVFGYLADIDNLPAWATEFARELKRDGDDYKVVNGLGEFFFERPHRVHVHDVPGARHARVTVRRPARVAAARVHEPRAHLHPHPR